MNLVKILLIILGILLFIIAGAAIYFFRFTHLRKSLNLESMAKDGPVWRAYKKMIDDCSLWLKSQKTEQVSITSFDGLRLNGTYIPATNAKACVILFHGYRSSALQDFAGVMQFYVNNGFNTLFVEHRACGESEGKYITFGINERQDALRWAQYADQRFDGELPIILHGISMGATTVMMASDLTLPESVSGLVADCGFTTPYDIIAHCAKQWFKLPAFPMVDILSSVAKVITGCGYRDCSTLDTLPHSPLPIFFIHGAKDNFVPAYMTEKNHAAANNCKGKLIVTDAGHAVSYLMDTEHYQKELSIYLAGVLGQ